MSQYIFQYEVWRNKRQYNYLGFLIISFITGLDMSIILAAIVPYLKNVVKTKNYQYYYGFAVSAYFVSAAVFGTLSGRLLDKTRKMKLFASFILLIQMAGNILYMLPFSPWCIVFGRLLAGAGEAFTSVASGEVIRIYDSEKTNLNLCWMAACLNFGYVIGPVLNAPFQSISFNIGIIHINKYNISGIIITSLLTVTLVVSQFLLHDCSREFDMKKFMNDHGFEKETSVANYFVVNHKAIDVYGEEVIYSKNKNKYSERLLKTGENMPPDIFALLKTILNRSEMLLLYVSSFWLMYGIFTTEISLPLINYNILQWNINALIIILTAYGIMLIATNIYLGLISKTTKSTFNIVLLCIFCMVLSFAFLVLFSMTIQRHFLLDVILISGYIFFAVFIWFPEQVALRSMLGRMVPSSMQSFAEAVRNSVARIAMVCASLFTPILMPYLHWVAVGLILVATFILIMFILHRNKLVELEIAKELIS